MSRKSLLENMEADELYNWSAYYMLQDPKNKEKLQKEITLENQKSLSDDERSKMIINMFKSLEKKNK